MNDENSVNSVSFSLGDIPKQIHSLFAIINAKEKSVNLNLKRTYIFKTDWRRHPIFFQIMKLFVAKTCVRRSKTNVLWFRCTNDVYRQHKCK